MRPLRFKEVALSLSVFGVITFTRSLSPTRWVGNLVLGFQGGVASPWSRAGLKPRPRSRAKRVYSMHSLGSGLPVPCYDAVVGSAAARV